MLVNPVRTDPLEEDTFVLEIWWNSFSVGAKKTLLVFQAPNKPIVGHPTRLVTYQKTEGIPSAVSAHSPITRETNVFNDVYTVSQTFGNSGSRSRGVDASGTTTAVTRRRRGRDVCAHATHRSPRSGASAASAADSPAPNLCSRKEGMLKTTVRNSPRHARRKGKQIKRKEGSGRGTRSRRNENAAASTGPTLVAETDQ